MANEVMQSLFGLDSASHAESLRQRQAAEDLAFAQLSPKQQVVYGMAQAGRQAGAGLNQLFGYVPPELQRVRSQEEALMEVQQSGIDLNDPEAVYPALAKALASRGLQQQAMMVAMQGQSAIAENMKQRAALLKAQQEGRGTEGERNIKYLAALEERLGKNEKLSSKEASTAMLVYHKLAQPDYVTRLDPASGAMYTMEVQGSRKPLGQSLPLLTRALYAVPGQPTPVPEIAPVQDGAATITPLQPQPPVTGFQLLGPDGEPVPQPAPAQQPAPVATPQWKAQTGPAMSMPPVTGQSALPGGVTVTEFGPTAMQKAELGIKGAQLKVEQDKPFVDVGSKTYNAWQQKAVEAQAAKDMANTALELLGSGAYTGVGAGAKLTAAHVANLFGVNISGQNETEQFNSIVSEIQLGRAQNLKGALSDNDLKFIRSTIQPGMTKKALISMLERLSDRAEGAITAFEHVNKVASTPDGFKGIATLNVPKIEADAIESARKRREVAVSSALTQAAQQATPKDIRDAWEMFKRQDVGRKGGGSLDRLWNSLTAQQLAAFYNSLDSENRTQWRKAMKPEVLKKLTFGAK